MKKVDIEAMKMAVEAIIKGGVKEQAKAVYTLRQAIEQAEKQEPVAWCNIETGEFSISVFWRKDLAKWAPLYTAPPKREWVGLTDDEIGEVCHKSPPDSHNYARDIEAKLKEKNT